LLIVWYACIFHLAAVAVWVANAIGNYGKIPHISRRDPEVMVDIIGHTGGIYE
jgi:hypothetical protein